MANSFQVNCYQINQKPINVGGVISQRIGFPTVGFATIRDCSQNLTARQLSTGVNVYSLIQTSDGTLWYVSETFAALAALIA